MSGAMPVPISATSLSCGLASDISQAPHDPAESGLNLGALVLAVRAATFFVFLVALLVDDLNFKRIEETSLALQVLHINAFDRFCDLIGFAACECANFFKLIVQRIGELDELSA